MRVVFLFLMLFAYQAFADEPKQTNRNLGRITGIVYGPSGAEEPGVTLLLTDASKPGWSWTIFSSIDGSFSFYELPPSEYELQAEGIGYRPYRQIHLKVAAGKTVSLYIALGEADFNASLIDTSVAFKVDTWCYAGSCSGSSRWSPENVSKPKVLSEFGLVDLVPTVDVVSLGSLQTLPKQGQDLEEFLTYLPGVSGSALPSIQKPGPLVIDAQMVLPAMTKSSQRW